MLVLIKRKECSGSGPCGRSDGVSSSHCDGPGCGTAVAVGAVVVLVVAVVSVDGVGVVFIYISCLHSGVSL